MICPEFRHWMKGIENVDSIAFNPSKWLMVTFHKHKIRLTICAKNASFTLQVHFDCTAMWVQDSGALHRTFNVDPLYLKHENSGMAIDFMVLFLLKLYNFQHYSIFLLILTPSFVFSIGKYL